MRLLRFTSAPDTGGAPEIQLFDESDGALTDGTAGKRPLVDLREESFESLIEAQGPLDRSLAESVDARPGRILVLLHGFEYEPTVGRKPGASKQPNPHNAIFHNREWDNPALEHKLHETPWLNRIGARADDLVIAFAFASDPGGISTKLDGKGRLTEWRRTQKRLWGRVQWNRAAENTFAHAYDLAAHYALGLAGILGVLARQWCGKDAPRISFIAHSLGTRVATAAIRRLCDRYDVTDAVERIDKVILLAAALSQHQIAGLSYDKWRLARKTGREPGIEFFNFTSQSDTVLRWIGAPLAAEVGRRIEARDADPDLWCAAEVIARAANVKPSAARLILGNIVSRDAVAGVHGAGSGADWLRWVDIPLDHPQTRNWGELTGLRLAGDLAGCKRDHWVHYTHKPNWKLYRRILEEPERWSVEAITSGVDASGARIRPPLTASPTERYRPVVVQITPPQASP